MLSTKKLKWSLQTYWSNSSIGKQRFDCAPSLCPPDGGPAAAAPRAIFTTTTFEKGDYVAPYEGELISPERNDELWIEGGQDMSV